MIRIPFVPPKPHRVHHDAFLLVVGDTAFDVDKVRAWGDESKVASALQQLFPPATAAEVYACAAELLPGRRECDRDHILALMNECLPPGAAPCEASLVVAGGNR